MSIIARGAAPLAVLLLGVLTGCGGDADTPSSSLSADEQTAADNLASQIVRTGDVSGESSAEDAVTEEQAQCISEGAVREVGLASLQDYGIITDDLKVNKGIQGVKMSADDADALAGVFVSCIDAEALFEKQFLSGAPGPETETMQKCVERAVDSDSVRAVLSASFQGRTAGVYDRLQEKVSACTGGKGSDK